MNREFLEAYNRELAILYERSKEFAEDYPGIAERLGGLTQDKLEPGLMGLFEGSAFLAARGQVKLQKGAVLDAKRAEALLAICVAEARLIL